MTKAPTSTFARIDDPRPKSGKPKATPMDRHVGSRVRLRRLEVGMSAEEFSQQIGVMRQQVEKWERAVNRLTSGRLYEISVVLNAPVAYFFEGFTGQAATGDATRSTITPALVEHGHMLDQLTPEQRRTVKSVMAGFVAANNAQPAASATTDDDE